MTVKVDRIEPNIFPTAEYVDARDAGRNAELIFGVKIEGRVIPVTIKLSYDEADALASLLEPLPKGSSIIARAVQRTRLRVSI